MTILSPNFRISEFEASQTASRLGIVNKIPPELMESARRTARGLEEIRTLLGVPIIITSGYRNIHVNRALKSKDSSQHCKGEAADFVAPRFGGPRQIVDAIAQSEIAFDELILECPPNGWVHVSFVKYKPRHEVLVIDADGTRPLYGE